MATVTWVVGNKDGNGEDARGGGMMVAMGHGLCVSSCLCGETTKNKLVPKKMMTPWSLSPCCVGQGLPAAWTASWVFPPFDVRG